MVHFQEKIVNRFLLSILFGFSGSFFLVVTQIFFGSQSSILAKLQLLQEVDLALAKGRSFARLGSAALGHEVEGELVGVEVEACSFELDDDCHVIEESVGLGPFQGFDLNLEVGLTNEATRDPGRTLLGGPPEDLKFLKDILRTPF